MKKRIAIDINEVLRDYIRQFANMYKKVVNPSFDVSYEEMIECLWEDLKMVQTQIKLTYDKVL